MAFMYKDENGSYVINIEMVINAFRDFFSELQGIGVVSKNVRTILWTLSSVFWIIYWLQFHQDMSLAWTIIFYQLVLFCVDYIHQGFDRVVRKSLNWWFIRVGIWMMVIFNVMCFVMWINGEF